MQYILSQVAVQIQVDDLVYDLIGEISSDEFSNENIEPLEKYLTSNHQGMARTKQAGRKTHDSQNSACLSAGGKTLALQNQIPSDSDSIEEAANEIPAGNIPL